MSAAADEIGEILAQRLGQRQHVAPRPEQQQIVAARIDRIDVRESGLQPMRQKAGEEGVHHPRQRGRARQRTARAKAAREDLSQPVHIGLERRQHRAALAAFARQRRKLGEGQRIACVRRRIVARVAARLRQERIRQRRRVMHGHMRACEALGQRQAVRNPGAPEPPPVRAAMRRRCGGQIGLDVENPVGGSARAADPAIHHHRTGARIEPPQPGLGVARRAARPGVVPRHHGRAHAAGGADAKPGVPAPREHRLSRAAQRRLLCVLHGDRDAVVNLARLRGVDQITRRDGRGHGDVQRKIALILVPHPAIDVGTGLIEIGALARVVGQRRQDQEAPARVLEHTGRRQAESGEAHARRRLGDQLKTQRAPAQHTRQPACALARQPEQRGLDAGEIPRDEPELRRRPVFDGGLVGE